MKTTYIPVKLFKTKELGKKVKVKVLNVPIIFEDVVKDEIHLKKPTINMDLTHLETEWGRHFE